MEISAKELCRILQGTLEGDPEVKIKGPSKIEEGKEGTISFLANLKYEPFVYTTRASVLLVNRDFTPSRPVPATLIRVDDVYAALALLLEKFDNSELPATGLSAKAEIHPQATVGEGARVGAFSVIAEGARIGANCRIHAQVYVGKDVTIGSNVTLYPGVKILQGCIVGNNCILHANVVIGSDGFGFVPQTDGSYQKIAQIGNVVLEEDVEIGANTVIDRATMGSTVIRKGVKLDNLIQVAHNVEIGEHTVIAAQAGIAGSTRIGSYCRIGGQAGFVGHISLADRVSVQAQSGVAASVKEPDTALYGSPALSYKDYLRAYAVFRRLPELSRKIHELEKQLEALQKE